ncbi:hypothetical protein [Ralstonia solanacearum]|uniref:hypothetical protein n=1 Tax=Ralstonia solanacearum TaxID=305 RepID=UPI00130170D2|nr:hypothetical protein [Ralstonia solanacearum]
MRATFPDGPTAEKNSLSSQIKKEAGRSCNLLCLGDDDREKMDSIERSVMASDPSASLKTGENDVNKNADYIYASIIDRTRKNKGLDFRYCGIDR